MVNSGVILGPLKAGPVTKLDLHRICPHPINPVTVRLTGEELKETILHLCFRTGGGDFELKDWASGEK